MMETGFACVMWALYVLTCYLPVAAGRTEPCAQVQRAYSAWKAHQGGNAKLSGIPGQVAYDCLRSMPFDSELAVKFLDEYIKYLQFHATIDDLKEPPSGYPSTSVNLLRDIQRIRGKATKLHYSSHYDFDYDVRYIVSRANDGHLGLELCSLSVMHFEHGVPLVSLSRDGLELPQIYTYADAESIAHGADMSPVIYINGQDPSYFLQASIAVTVGLQDPDARYNSLFPSPTAGFEGRYGGGYWTNHLGLWPGPRHTLEFANGTQIVLETTASLSLKHFNDVVDGKSLFRAACLPNSSNDEDEGRARVVRGQPFGSDIPSTGPLRYPLPLIRHEGDLVRGYYLDDEHQDVAVLQLPTFKLDDWVAKGLSLTTRKFLDRAHADGKTRLIIDMSGNGGGDVNAGFNIFRILFPRAGLETRTRFRRTELIRLMGKVFSSTQGKARYKDNFPLDLPLVAHLAVSPNQRHAFGSWESLYGSTGTVSEMYATFNFTSASTENNPIEGYGPVSKSHASPIFGADRIVIMTDGYCASTCVLLASLLTGQGVRSIVFGGRPRHAPMQLLGGVKGGQYWSLRTASRYIQEAYDIALHASHNNDSILSSAEMARYRDIAPLPLEDFPLRFDKYGSSGINFRNAYGEDDDNTPLQFVYKAADCRLFFTAENVVRPETMWAAAVRTMFGNGSCVSGPSN